MILLPSATVRIQRAGLVSSVGAADFFVLPVADQGTNKLGLVSACDVEFSTTKEATAATATFEVANLHPNTVRQMADQGYVKIDAGYVGHLTRPIQCIFFGRMDSYKYRLSSGKIKWTFTATAFPNDIWAIRPNADSGTNQDGSPRSILVGEAIRIIADRIGIGRANVDMPKLFDGDLSDTTLSSDVNAANLYTETFRNAVTLNGWSTKDIAIVELQDLMAIVSQAVRQTFGVLRNYSLLPDVNDPFKIVIEDVSRFSGRSLSIDLDSNLIIDAGPSGATSTLPPTDEPPTTDGAEEPLTTIDVPEYQVVSVFDPIVSMGLLVVGKSVKMGISSKFIVKKGKHTLNGSPLRWRTEYSGELKNEVTVGRGS